MRTVRELRAVRARNEIIYYGNVREVKLINKYKKEKYVIIKV